MISVSKKRVELFKELMKCFVDEVERGAHPLQAGWMKAESLEANMLVELGLAEKGEKGIRLLFDRDLRIGLGNTSDEEAEELIYICSDLARAVEVEKLITRVANDLPNSSQLQAGIVTLGWWRMFKTSEFPVVVDEVLREGFSPDGWYIGVPKASLELALTLANKWWEVDIRKSFEILKEFSFPIPEASKTEIFDRVKKVLRWEEVLKILPEEESKAIAFLWCADYLCISKGLCYPQSLNFVQASAWKIISKRLGKDIPEIMEQLGEVVDQLPFQSFISWAEIIRFPW